MKWTMNLNDREISQLLVIYHKFTGEAEPVTVDFGREIKIVPWASIRFDDVRHGCVTTFNVHEDFVMDVLILVEEHMETIRSIGRGFFDLLKGATCFHAEIVEHAKSIAKKWEERAHAATHMKVAEEENIAA